jgi:hypothetical protein
VAVTRVVEGVIFYLSRSKGKDCKERESVEDHFTEKSRPKIQIHHKRTKTVVKIINITFTPTAENANNCSENQSEGEPETIS